MEPNARFAFYFFAHEIAMRAGVIEPDLVELDDDGPPVAVDVNPDLDLGRLRDLYIQFFAFDPLRVLPQLPTPGLSIVPPSSRH